MLCHRICIGCTKQWFRFGRTAVAVLVSGFIGLGIAKKPVKSTLSEKQFLVFLSGKYRPRISRAPGKPGAVKKKSLQVPETVEIVARDSTRIPTVKIVGVLRDLLGNPLANQELEVYINNRLYSRIKTGSMGEYTVYYSPEGPGLYEVEIRIHGQRYSQEKSKNGCGE